MKPAVSNAQTLYGDLTAGSSKVLLKMSRLIFISGTRSLNTYALLDDGSERTILFSDEAKKLVDKLKHLLVEARFDLCQWASNIPGVISQKAHAQMERTEPTMRSIYWIIASQYDPLGFINPFTTRTKVLVKKFWDKKREWDDPDLPEDLLKSIRIRVLRHRRSAPNHS
ncbi:hypothetical protein AAFF_G00343510 [Aldrovandia affinis]|uniref:Uncharacterized protein n=1 Tax=Aldrovandia affinis TaxID=143900 RepID=A0AAD7SM48_9TELE|nr:hypothetical protein AAFF_G00343510 [Aldrovandia affinis]